jgi:hypothetical protein
MPTVIACFMDLNSPEEAFQVQEHFNEEEWMGNLLEWLNLKGWDLGSLQGHLYTDEFYLVTGVSPRNTKINHVCIYQNGKLYHDPHPDGNGILTENNFQYLEKL